VYFLLISKNAYYLLNIVMFPNQVNSPFIKSLLSSPGQGNW